MKIRESYHIADFKTRENENEKIIEGYFIVYEQKTELWKDCFEELARGSCFKSIADNDIRALYNHNSDVVLGRKSAGTLTLRSDDYGVFCSIKVNPNDTEAMNMYERVKRHDISGCSFGFYPTNEEVINNSDGSTTFRVIQADVLEVSVCVFPAYPQTSIEARKNDLDNYKKRQLHTKKLKLKEMLNNVKSIKTK